MKYNPLDGDRAANYYDSLPEKEKEGVMSLDEALKIKKYKKEHYKKYKSQYITEEEKQKIIKGFELTEKRVTQAGRKSH